MDSLLNSSRPPVFCPGCAHEQVLHALDRALTDMKLSGQEIAIVSDIGCSGLFDTFFNTHAFHGLHGRALTYATGIKMANPGLKVIVTMGDGGLGIGGAHVLSTCRRNIDLTLLVLNNFNYGMTGGQCSPTTPQEAVVGSGFLNKLEKPLNICEVAGEAGAPYVARLSTYDRNLTDQLQAAIAFEGFSLLDIWGICPGRYSRRNKLNPKTIDAELRRLPELKDFKKQNDRLEYSQAYRQEAANQVMPSEPPQIRIDGKAPFIGRNEIVLLGSAGQRVITAGEILCLAGISAGGHATQKNDYPITVMRGHSISEIILSDVQIDYTGIDNPAIIVALAPEGVARRKKMFAALSKDAKLISVSGIDLPPSAAAIFEVDVKAKKIQPQDYALALLAIVTQHSSVLNIDMLDTALKLRFNHSTYEAARSVMAKALS